jgi:hypothetical protein
MRFVTNSPFADPDVAARKLIDIANAVEALQNGPIYIELVNGPFLKAGGTPGPVPRRHRQRGSIGLARAA